MQATTMADASRNWSVAGIFGEVTRDRKGFGKIHNTRRRRYDKMSLDALKVAYREIDNDLEKEYIQQNINIIQLSRNVIHPPV